MGFNSQSFGGGGGGGVLLKQESFVRTTYLSTTSLVHPPTVVMFSNSYTKLSATSRLDIDYAAVMQSSAINTTYYLVGFHGSTSLTEIQTRSLAGSNYLHTVKWLDEVSGLASGAVTLGIKWSTTSGTLASQILATMRVQEIEP